MGGACMAKYLFPIVLSVRNNLKGGGEALVPVEDSFCSTP